MNLQDCIGIIRNCTTLACEYHIKNKCDYGYEVRENRFECAKKLAINALKKQVPKKIIYRKQNYGTPYLCCECEADQTPTEFFCEDGSEPIEKHTYCWKCGQKLDWSEVR